MCWLGTFAGHYGVPRLWTSSFNDQANWNQPYYGRTIQYADVNGDGFDDVCGRKGDGIICELSDGRSHFVSPHTWTSEFNNNDGWANEPFYETIRIRDLNNDGKADIEGFGPKGYLRLYSNGTDFVRMVR